MKVIVEGGITSKNVPPNSRDAVLLTMYSDLASGIALNIFYTNDKKIVALNDDQVSIMTNGNTSLEDTHSDQVLKHNIGSKVTTHHPIKLEDIFNLYKDFGSNKLILLKIDGILLENEIFLNQLMHLINSFPLIETYILSDNVDKLQNMSFLNTKARIGVCVDENTINNLDKTFDFYSLKPNIVIHDIVNNICGSNRAIFIDNINTVEELNELKKSLTEPQSNSVFIVTQNYGQIMSNL